MADPENQVPREEGGELGPERAAFPSGALFLACLVVCLVIPPQLLLPTVSPHRACSENSFTLRIGRLSMRCVSNLLELLAGKIKTKDVVMENLSIEVPQSGGTLRIFVPEVRAPYAVMRVSFLQVLGLAITRLPDLVPLLLGKTVTWNNVTITAGQMYAENLQLKDQRIWAGRGEGGLEFTAGRVVVSHLSIEDTLGDNRFVIGVPRIWMEEVREELGGGLYLLAPKLLGSDLRVEAVSVSSFFCFMASMEITERTRTTPHRVLAREVTMEGYVMGYSSMNARNLEFPEGWGIG